MQLAEFKIEDVEHDLDNGFVFFTLYGGKEFMVCQAQGIVNKVQLDCYPEGISPEYGIEKDFNYIELGDDSVFEVVESTLDVETRKLTTKQLQKLNKILYEKMETV